MKKYNTFLSNVVYLGSSRTKKNNVRENTLFFVHVGKKSGMKKFLELCKRKNLTKQRYSKVKIA